MAEYDTKCLICNHYDHFQATKIFPKMCWNGFYWDKECKCEKYISTNLEYLEYKYDKKNQK